MITPRIIPCLLLQNNGLVKGVQFKNYRYIGDPVNAVRIFSQKEVDELILLDISATKEKRILNPEIVAQIADESYMPFVIGGGIRSIENIRLLLNAGAEKVSINTAAVENPYLIRQAANTFGSQSIIISIDVKKDWLGKYHVYTHSGKKKTKLNPVDWAVRMQEYGAGEILINSINQDGMMQGYDTNLIKTVASRLKIPVIAAGGAGNAEHLSQAITSGASAAAAGSMFVFHGKKQGILINYILEIEHNDIKARTHPIKEFLI